MTGFGLGHDDSDMIILSRRRSRGNLSYLPIAIVAIVVLAAFCFGGYFLFF